MAFSSVDKFFSLRFTYLFAEILYEFMKHSELTILLVRITIALFFLLHGVRKMESGWVTSDAQLHSVLSNYHDNAHGLQKTFLEKVALPYGAIWSSCITFGEMALGISLLIGLLTNISLLTGLLMVLCFGVANGNLLSTDAFTELNCMLLIVSLLFLFVAKCGYKYGVDGMVSVKVGKKKGSGGKSKKAN